ncbi:MAG: hypothetical protein IMW90_13990 [Thermogemmatispora sp.]|nr:hypothetical protein [Thermogemmatispora sp.]MBE3566830.1 hypothetical protein [Thermogemmatispora sp.]
MQRPPGALAEGGSTLLHADGSYLTAWPDVLASLYADLSRPVSIVNLSS